MNKQAREAIQNANDELLDAIDILEELSEDHDELRDKLQPIISVLVNASENLDELN